MNNDKTNLFKKISNYTYIILILLSILNLLNFSINGYDKEMFDTHELFINNIVLNISTLIGSIIILYITNKKKDIYKIENPTSLNVFNYLMSFEIVNILFLLALQIANIINKTNIDISNLLSALLGYIPAVLTGLYIVNKKNILKINNTKRENFLWFIIIWLYMNYYINIISLTFQMIFNTSDISVILPRFLSDILLILLVMLSVKLLKKNKKLN